MKFLILLVSAALVAANENVPKNLEVTPPLRAICRLQGSTANGPIQGNVTFSVTYDGKVHVQGDLAGLPPAAYAFHVHEKGDITGGCGSTGGHFNPEHKNHGHPNDEDRHVGDLGNVEFTADGTAHIDFVDDHLALFGPHNILGRAVVLHAGSDDFGRTNHPDSKKTGNAGGRVACGVIGILDPVTGWDFQKSSATPSSVASITILAVAATLYR